MTDKNPETCEHRHVRTITKNVGGKAVGTRSLKIRYVCNDCGAEV